MTRYKCPRCKGNQYSASPDKAHEPCIYCDHEGTVPMRSLEEEGTMKTYMNRIDREQTEGWP